MGPFLVSEVSYSADAIRDRIERLDRAAEHASRAVMSAAVWSCGGSSRLLLAERARRLLTDIDRIRDALASVLDTVLSGEGERHGLVERGALIAVTCVVSGLSGCLEAAFRQTAWPVIGPLAARVVDGMPVFGQSPRRVSVSPRPGFAASPPASVQDRVARIPSGPNRIRIERYPTAEGNRFEVYIAGTNFSGGVSDPWNIGSNGELVATGWSPSLEAVRTAMRDAGITRDTPVVVTGHSQGGLIGLTIAASGEFDVDGIITVGTPVGAVPTLQRIPAVHLIHPEDPVPALGGTLPSPSSTWLISPRDGEWGADAHHREVYLSSAGVLDRQGDTRVPRFATIPASTTLGIAREYAARVSASNPGPGEE